MSDSCFLDTSVLLYVLSEDIARADRAEQLLAQAPTVSVQVLNEFASVAMRKLAMSHAEVREVLNTVRAVCRVESLTAETHDRAIVIAERYRFSFYDSVIVSSALLSGCSTLYSEDLQHRQLIEQQLRVVNPFL